MENLNDFMENQDPIGKLLGQNAIYTEIIDCDTSKKYLITAPSGCGKHYLIRRLEAGFSTQIGISVFAPPLVHSFLSQEQDFAPFLQLLTEKEKLSFQNTIELGKSVSEFIPYVGQFISKALTQKKGYPAIFCNAEIELLTRLERLIGSSNIVFLCEEIERWDQASLRFLHNLFSYSFRSNSRKVIFICTSTVTEFPIPGTFFDKIYPLEFIRSQHIETVLDTIIPNHSLEADTIQKIHQLSGGNIGIIIQLSTLVEEGSTDLVNTSHIYRDITLRRLQNVLSELRYSQAVELLDRASLIGERIYAELLRIFTKYDPVTFSDSVKNAVEQNILQEGSDNIAFNNKSIWQAFYAESFKKQEFHYELAICVRKLMPSNYAYIANELFNAGQGREAALYYVLSALNHYHTYRIMPTLFEPQSTLIKKYDLYDSYQYIANLYTNYFAGNFTAVLQSEYQLKDACLSFEADFVKSLVHINGSVKLSEYSQTLTVMESWLEDETFRSQYPYQWMRAAIFTLGIQFELHDDSMYGLLKEVEKTKRKYIASDKGIEWLEYDFLSKCNYCYSVDMAYHYTKEAVVYFKDHLPQAVTMYPYYTSLLNFSANALVLGRYQESMKFSAEAMELTDDTCLLYGDEDALVNNFLISAILDGQLKNAQELELAIAQLQRFISQPSEDVISKILLRNNLAIMLCYKNNFTAATQEIELLYEELLHIEDVDDYYLYFVGNNHCILRYLTGGQEFDYQRFHDLCQLDPLYHDRSFFIAREKSILEQVKSGVHIDLSKSSWNELPGLHVGPAWSFWGKWLLFSDLQIWSD